MPGKWESEPPSPRWTFSPYFKIGKLTRKGIQHALELLRQWREANVRPICGLRSPSENTRQDSGVGELMTRPHPPSGLPICQ